MPRFLTIGLALIIAALTLMPVPSGPPGPVGLDKLSHLLAFGALAVPLSWRHPRISRLSSTACMPSVVFITSAIPPSLSRSTMLGRPS